MKELEIEIKYYCNDHLRVIKKAVESGGKLIRNADERDFYYNHPSRDFKVTDEVLRIRRTDSRVILTYKGPKLGGIAKSRIEDEVDISDFNSINLILEHLGFVKSGEVIKNREFYLLGDITICIDNVKELGCFVELEKIGTAREDIENELVSLAEKLGLEKVESRSYLEMILEKKTGLP